MFLALGLLCKGWNILSVCCWFALKAEAVSLSVYTYLPLWRKICSCEMAVTVLLGFGVSKWSFINYFFVSCDGSLHIPLAG